MIEKTIHVELRPNEVILTTNTERKIRRVIPERFVDELSIDSLLMTYDEVVELAHDLEISEETLKLIDQMKPSIRQARLLVVLRMDARRDQARVSSYDEIKDKLIDEDAIPYTETTPRKWERKTK